MAVPNTDETSHPDSNAVRPSWETARPRPAVPSSRPAVIPAPSSATAPAASVPPVSMSPVAYETPLDPTVKYDLAGNPIPGSGQPVSVSPVPVSYAAGNAPAGVWPPPVGGQGTGGAQVYSNTSGQQSHLPPEIERLRWHWGAFFFPTYWTRRHGLRQVAFVIVGGLVVLRLLRSQFAGSNSAAFFALCALYVVACLGVKIYFGLNGHKIGWRNRHFPGGLEQYFLVQNRWMWWGFGINALSVVVLIALLIGIVVLGHNPFQAPANGSGSYSSGSFNHSSQ